MICNHYTSGGAQSMDNDCVRLTFEPLLQEEGSLGAYSVGGILGTGNGRGIGLIFVLSGFLLMIYSFLMLVRTTRNYHGRADIGD